MDIIKRINEFLVIYDRLPELRDNVGFSNVYTFADYKIQQYVAWGSKSKSVMISKFDYSLLDYRNIGTILNYKSTGVINASFKFFDSPNSLYIHGFCNSNNSVIRKIANLNCEFTKNTSTDEYFNYTVGYDIVLSHDELLELFEITKNIKHHIQIYKW